MSERKKLKNLSKREHQLALIFSTFSLFSASLIIIIILIAISIVNNMYGNFTVPTLFSLISALISFLVMYTLDKNKKLVNQFLVGKYNFRWIVIFLISLIFTLIILFSYWSLTDFANKNIENIVNLNFIVFLVGSTLFNISAYLTYFGIKNLRAIKIQKIKFRIFSTISTSLLIISVSGLIFISFNFISYPSANITSGTKYDEGPWLTWYNNKPNESICITWLTEKSGPTEVHYGMSKNKSELNLIATGDAGILHKIYLDALRPGTTYHYFIEKDTSSLNTEPLFSFTTASNQQKSFKFTIVGDMQPTDEGMIKRGEIVANGVNQRDHDFIIQLGDVADSGTDPQDWHRVLSNIMKLGSTVPIQGVIGNHDWDGGAGSSNWAQLFTYNYEDPTVGRFYSFDYQNAHFVMIDNFEHFYRMTDAQLNWIQEDLLNAKKEGQDWIFCFFHLSMLTTSSSGMQYNLIESLVPIFDKYDVDAVFYGHDHDYQHYKYTYGQNGLVFDKSHDWDHNPVHYFCSGGGGADLEVGYGILDESRMAAEDTVMWWDENLNSTREITYERRAWDSSKYLTHLDFDENYAYWKPGYEGKYYYNLPAEESYNDFADVVGLKYGEQCYHYIEVEVNGNHCIISVRYPNGVLLEGPRNNYPQQFILEK